MRYHLEALLEELRRRQTDGEDVVYLEESTLEALRRLVADVNQEERAAAERARVEEAINEVGRSGPVRATAPTPAADPNLPAPPEIILPAGDKRSRWEWLRGRVLGCPVCQAHVKPGRQVVFGVGSLDAEIFFCGEAPGEEEEQAGEPFVGPAGQLLTKIIQAMGLSREQVYIGNIMNWRPEVATPTGNRPPTDAEMAFCLPYLRAQLEIVQPKVIVALGNTAVSGLLGPDPKRRMGQIRGHWQSFAGLPLMPTYHPSYLLRNGTLASKRQVWEDILLVMEKLALPISEKQRRYFTAG